MDFERPSKNKENKSEKESQDFRDQEVITDILETGSNNELEELRNFHNLSKEEFNTLEKFAKLRREAKEISKKDLKNRKEENPEPSKEELKAGTYKEALEPQVREAVFNLRSKGYNTYSSGFRGFKSQSIEFDPVDELEEFDSSEDLKNKFEELNVDLRIDNDKIVFECDDFLDLENMRDLWSSVEKELPGLGQTTPVNQIPAAESFREKHSDNIESFQEYNGMDNIVQKVKDLHIKFAEQYLSDNNLLKDKIVDYYSDEDRLKNELSNVFENLSDEEIEDKIIDLKEKLKDKTFFIEHYQKIFERNDAKNRAEKRRKEDPIATDEEYKLGVYKEALEKQVKNAVFELFRKNYKTFESGFREGDSRDQYIGVFNKDIDLPGPIKNYFEEKEFKVSIDHQEDRTIFNIHPLSNNPVTLEEWEKIWNEFANMMPEADTDEAIDSKEYTLHSEFRKFQDKLRR